MAQSHSPTLTLVGVLVLVFLLQIAIGVFGGTPLAFALTWPLTHRPWTLLTSVFAHGGPLHLVTNVVGLAVLGMLLERNASSARFYAFFVGVGALAGATEVTIAHVLGYQVAVLGASGAIFGLLGYLLAGNTLTDAVAARVSLGTWPTIVLILAVAVGITWLTRGRSVALIAHFTGVVLGLLAGKAHLLNGQRTGRSSRYRS